MTKSTLFSLLLSASVLTAPASERHLMDRGWKFQAGDSPGAEAPGFDDGAWRALDLPHDFMIEGVKGAKPGNMDGPFDKGSPAGAGGASLNGGVAWYRKTFNLPAEAKGHVETIYFEGAYMNADVWLNGHHLGMHPYGFTGFHFDISDKLEYGGKNVLAVRLNVVQPCCRWYSGGGLYRDVWLIESNPVHLQEWGTAISTPKVDNEHATVKAQSIIRNDGDSPAVVEVVYTILGPDGTSVSAFRKMGNVSPHGALTAAPEMAVANPKLWSTETPILYKLVAEVKSGGLVVDREEMPFGIRTFEFTLDRGFLLNGKRVEIQGVCNHHDQGSLGAAAYPRAIERQLEILKSMGCNAIRTSHNPPAPALLDACDRLGFVVMDEAFDEWKEGHFKYGYAPYFDDWSEADMMAMLDRDRNHPCVVLWSIGNEIPEGRAGKPAAGPIAERLAAICHREDPTRPVTSACPSPGNDWKCGLAKALDVFGINYQTGFYGTNSPAGRAHPSADANRYDGSKPMVSSESQSQVDSRGEYGLELDGSGSVVINPKPRKEQVSSYDIFRPGWATSTEREFSALHDSPWVAGEFVWTGFDYLGEPTPYGWPSRSSYFGILDTCGFPKDRYYQFKAHWTNEPVVHVMPHWTWPGFEGKPIPVYVYSNADSVELFLNGKSLGEQHFPDVAKGEKPAWHLEWQVPYEPGEIKAVGKKNGVVIATDIVRTADAPARLVAKADRPRIAADGRDLSYVTVSVVDKDGNICPDAAPELDFAIAGDAAEIASLDDGDPVNHEAFQGRRHRAFHGLALAIVKSRPDAAGEATLKVSGAGLESADVKIKVANVGM